MVASEVVTINDAAACPRLEPPIDDEQDRHPVQGSVSFVDFGRDLFRT